jgi:hypothetical protein
LPIATPILPQAIAGSAWAGPRLRQVFDQFNWQPRWGWIRGHNGVNYYEMERDMRLVHVVLVTAFAIFTAPALGEDCDLLSNLPEASALPASQLASPHFSSFHGISLNSSPGDVLAAARARGFATEVTTYVDSGWIAAVHIRESATDCRDVGIVDFARDGRPSRIQLGARYFCSTDVSVGEFARRLFRTYGVRTDKVDDDNCFQDVTCFRGHTAAREEFLLLRLSYQPEVFVRRDSE